MFNYCRSEPSAVIAWLIREAGGSGTEELKMASPFTRCPVNREFHVKENPDRKKTFGYLNKYKSKQYKHL